MKHVDDSGTATGTTVSRGGSEVHSSGTAIGTIVSDGGLQIVFANASGTRVQSGGILALGGNASVSDFIVSSGGALAITMDTL